MTRSAGRLFVLGVLVGAAFLALPAAADEREEWMRVRGEISKLELELEHLKRRIPLAGSPAERPSWLRQGASAVEMSPFELVPIASGEPLLQDLGARSPVKMDRFEISGLDPAGRVLFFFSRLALHPRMTRLESLRLEPAAAETVRYTAVVGLPYFDPPPWEPSPFGPPSAMLAADRRRLEEMRTLIAAIREYAETADPVARFAIVQNEIEDASVAFTAATLGAEIAIEGALIGSVARDTLLSAFEKAGLRIIGRAFDRTGPCQTFEIRAAIEPAEETHETVSGNGSFDHDPMAVCDPPPAGESKRVVVRSSTAPDETRAQMRLRNVDLADLFGAIHHYLGQHFIVDGDVKGRVTLDVLEGATLDDLWSGLSGLGTAIGEPPLRHVTRSRAAAPARGAAAGAGVGEPVTFLLKDADVSDVLCIAAEILGREIEMPAGLRARVSVFAGEIPIGELASGVIASARLEPSDAGERLVLRRPGQKEEASVPVCGNRDFTPSSPLTRAPRRLDLLEIADIQVVGLAQFAQSWMAWAYMPGRYMTPLEEGSVLLDGTVRSIGPDGVVFATREGKGVVASIR